MKGFDRTTNVRKGSSFLQICAIAALLYCGNVFAGTYEYEEESLDTSESQMSTEDQQANKSEMKDQWKDFLDDQKEKEEKKEIKRYGTKDQWQDFFDLQEQSENKPFTKRLAKVERLKKKSERKKKEEIAFNKMSDDLEKMHIDDKFGKKLKNESRPIPTGRLIDINQDEDESMSDQRHYQVNLSKQKHRESGPARP